MEFIRRCEGRPQKARHQGHGNAVKEHPIHSSTIRHKNIPSYLAPYLTPELEYHPYVLTHLQPLLDLQAKHNIVTQAFGPLSPLLRHPGGPLKPVLTKIAQRVSKDSGKEVDEAQVLLLWTIQNGVVAITTSTKEENIKKLAEVDTLPDLTKEEVKEIEDVGRGVHFRAYTVSLYWVSGCFKRPNTGCRARWLTAGTYDPGVPRPQIAGWEIDLRAVWSREKVKIGEKAE